MNFHRGIKLKTGILACMALCTIARAIEKDKDMEATSGYRVVKLKKPMTIDGNWDKSQWQTVVAIELKYFMGEIQKFHPVVKAKMMYDRDNLYVIFKVEDRYVRCVTQEINGPVWDDSCVELFFSPDSGAPSKYFNLEVNCGGTPLMYYNIVPRKDYTILEPDDIKQIEIAHSLPGLILNEITEPVTWTIEYKIPLSILEKYAPVTRPGPGVVWRANFYKIADKTSNPHYLTWSPVRNSEPDFHLPQFFGTLRFQ